MPTATPNRQVSGRSLYFLRLGADYLEDCIAFSTMRQALDHYAEVARELDRIGQKLDATLHLARSLDELQEYPDFVLSLTKNGNVKKECA